MFSLLWAALAATEPIDIKVWHAYRGVEQDALLSLLEAYDDAHPELIVSPLYITPSDHA